MSRTSRRGLLIGTLAADGAAGQTPRQPNVTQFVRFQKSAAISHGILNGEGVQPIARDLFGAHKKTGAPYKLGDVTRKMNPGDVVEVDIEGIGVLRNPVRAALQI